MTYIYKIKQFIIHCVQCGGFMNVVGHYYLCSQCGCVIDKDTNEIMKELPHDLYSE